MCENVTAVVFLMLLCWICAGAQGKCSTYSDRGPVVQLGSDFKVFCTFNRIITDMRDASIHVDKQQIYISTGKYNSTTIFASVEGITADRTYTCKCKWCKAPCGLDIFTGHPPDVPQNLTCTQKGEFGNVTCAWRPGRATYIESVSRLWVETCCDNSTKKATSYKGSDSVTFPIRDLHSQYSVWVTATNKLGSRDSTRLSFTLGDIVKPKPPEISRVNCSSRQCIIYWANVGNSQLLQTRYRLSWGIWRNQSWPAKGSTAVYNLRPFTMYEFQGRCKLNDTRGLWSEWGTVITSRTDEEAPQQLDIWYTEDSLNPGQPFYFTVLWKKLSETEARGKILGYVIKVQDLQHGHTKEYTTNSSSGWPITCTHCKVFLSAYNSRGLSRPAPLTISQQTAPPPYDVVYKPLGNNSIAISWQNPATAGPLLGYLVEWLPSSLPKGKLQWKRTSPAELHTIITENIKPNQCYQGAVYALYQSGTGKATFKDAYSAQSAPAVGPSCNVAVQKDKVTVTWSQIPWEQQRGCLTGYTVYLSTPGESAKPIAWIGPSQTHFTTAVQKPGQYGLSITGRTAAGEGQRGHEEVFFISLQDNDQEIAFAFVVACPVLLLCIIVLYLCHHRMSTCSPCLTLNVVPDPANSKWAKEYTTFKGQITLGYKLNLNSALMPEEKPDTVEICKVTQHLKALENRNSSDCCESTSNPTSWSATEQPLFQVQPTCTYLKSFSHESDTSEQTQLSHGTEVTMDYISSPKLLEMDSHELETDSFFAAAFFPCPQSTFLEPLGSFECKLTLDAVKIDCSELMGCT